MTTIFKNVDLNGTLTDITVKDGVIADLSKTAEAGKDMQGAKLYPGLIDIHIHGCVGDDATVTEDLSPMSKYLHQNGITSWLPTTMSAPHKDLLKATSNKKAPKAGEAEVLGFHVEGPYINTKNKGAMCESFIRRPSLDEAHELHDVKMMTVAPEIEEMYPFITALSREGVVMSLGHTVADYQTAVGGFSAGAKCVTHLFNAMPGMHHREPSLFGAAVSENAYVQVISDGLHLHPTAVLTAYRVFGADRMILISDAMCATGLSDGSYMFGGQEICVKNGEARIPAGNLAGSTTLLSKCVRKAVSFGIPEKDAFKMATETPATLLGLTDRGKIEVGYLADLFFVDKDLYPVATYTHTDLT